MNNKTDILSMNRNQLYVLPNILSLEVPTPLRIFPFTFHFFSFFVCFFLSMSNRNFKLTCQKGVTLNIGSMEPPNQAGWKPFMVVPSNLQFSYF